MFNRSVWHFARSLGLALLLLSPHAVTASRPYCERLAFDGSTLNGLGGQYDIVGQHPLGGRPYNGALRLEMGENAYIVTRTIGRRKLQGTAWLEVCGPDKYQLLRVRWNASPQSIEYVCFLRGDGDNDIRATCNTVHGRGLEAWFQRHD